MSCPSCRGHLRQRLQCLLEAADLDREAVQLLARCRPTPLPSPRRPGCAGARSWRGSDDSSAAIRVRWATMRSRAATISSSVARCARLARQRALVLRARLDIARARARRCSSATASRTAGTPAPTRNRASASPRASSAAARRSSSPADTSVPVRCDSTSAGVCVDHLLQRPLRAQDLAQRLAQAFDRRPWARAALPPRPPGRCPAPAPRTWGWTDPRPPAPRRPPRPARGSATSPSPPPRRRRPPPPSGSRRCWPPSSSATADLAPVVSARVGHRDWPWRATLRRTPPSRRTPARCSSAALGRHALGRLGDVRQDLARRPCGRRRW